ncbi:unnamed protein product [Rotaria sp. Silwood1]|nr:unnamed protein product [Rotaria sp. Silwood1]CAF1413434.1 unnamed protein product [Rotaria sp. Silwood1]CAF3530465.1 unnamed protein product [Rotaria sp. Silwood1]CAF3537636.1 unnamed protein product [Rotaria sp. Silwood1]CAF4621645.1 unnamed protein product [Rotaria sp. Silwood1]
MKQIKPQNSTADGDKKKKVAVALQLLSRNSMARFKDLSTQLIYEFFEYLNYINNRFQKLLKHSTLPIKVKLLFSSKSTFERYYTHIVIFNQHLIKSLYLSNPLIIDCIFYRFLWN